MKRVARWRTYPKSMKGRLEFDVVEFAVTVRSMEQRHIRENMIIFRSVEWGWC